MNQWTKKVTTAALIVAMVLPAFASAETSTTSVAAMLEQLKTLQAQMDALQAQRQATVLALARTLKEGLTGDDVKMLQALLASDPSIYPEGKISGFYGKLTAQAVKRFQKKHGLDQVGNVGPKTLRKLQKLLEENPLEMRDVDENDNDHRDGDHNKRTGSGTTTKHVLCHKVPPGHMVAPGWLRKHDDDKPIVPDCQTLPKGIRDLLNKGTTTPPTSTSTTDTTAPVISAVTTSSVATTTATVSWTTNESATGNVYFGTMNPVVTASSTMVVAGTLGTSQSVSLSGLSASTTYFYLVTAKDTSNNVSTSAQQSFTTTN